MTVILLPPEDEAGKRAWAKGLLQSREELFGAVGGEAILHTAASILGPKAEAELDRWLTAKASEADAGAVSTRLAQHAPHGDMR